MDLVEQADALYALPLDRFVEARNAAAKKAVQAGDRELAAALRALPKPASAAWLVNMLVHRRREEVEQVLELATSLKEAQAGPDRARLHALGQQRQRLLSAVARRSLAAAADAGHEVGPAALPDVEQTLRAALADPAAAAAVLTGRLLRTLEATGWDPVDLEGAVAGPFDPPPGDVAEGTDAEDVPGPRKARTKTPTARERREAETRLSAARDALAVAEQSAADLQRKAQRLTVRRDGLTASIEDLEERLDALRRELADLDGEAAALDREASDAVRTVAEAREAEEAAESAVARPDR